MSFWSDTIFWVCCPCLELFLASVVPSLFDLLSITLVSFVVKQCPYRRSRRLQSLSRKVVYFLTNRWFFRLPAVAESLNSSVGSNEIIYFSSMCIHFIRNFVIIIVKLNVITCYLSFYCLCFYLMQMLVGRTLCVCTWYVNICRFIMWVDDKWLRTAYMHFIYVYLAEIG